MNPEIEALKREVLSISRQLEQAEFQLVMARDAANKMFTTSLLIAEVALGNNPRATAKCQELVTDMRDVLRSQGIELNF